MVFAGTVLGQLVFGYLVDRYGRRPGIASWTSPNNASLTLIIVSRHDLRQSVVGTLLANFGSGLRSWRKHSRPFHRFDCIPLPPGYRHWCRGKYDFL